MLELVLLHNTLLFFVVLFLFCSCLFSIVDYNTWQSESTIILDLQASIEKWYALIATHPQEIINAKKWGCIQLYLRIDGEQVLRKLKKTRKVLKENRVHHNLTRL